MLTVILKIDVNQFTFDNVVYMVFTDWPERLGSVMELSRSWNVGPGKPRNFTFGLAE